MQISTSVGVLQAMAPLFKCVTGLQSCPHRVSWVSALRKRRLTHNRRLEVLYLIARSQAPAGRLGGKHAPFDTAIAPRVRSCRDISSINGVVAGRAPGASARLDRTH